MEAFPARLRRVGNSLGLLVPRDVLDAMHLVAGADVDVVVLPRGQHDRRYEVIGSFGSLAPFQRERKDRY